MHSICSRLLGGAVSLGILFVLSMTARSGLSPASQSKEEFVKYATAEIGRQLPYKIDPMTTCTQVMSTDDTIILRYDVNAHKSQVKLHREQMEAILNKHAHQQTVTQTALDKGIRLQHRYYDVNGSYIFEFLIHDDQPQRSY